MAGKAKFDQEAAFKSIIGADRRLAEKLQEETEKPKKNKDRVQRAYFLDRDIDKALRRIEYNDVCKSEKEIDKPLGAPVK